MIEAVNLTKTFNSGAAIAADDISFTCADGEIVGFIGPNGAGKTTTIKMLTGIIRPDSGSVKINGFDMAEKPLECKKIIGYISDNPDMFVKLTGYEFINFMADVYGVPENVRAERIDYFAEQFGMEKSVFSQRMTGYSHGMRQKTMIIATLVHDPKVWILDEPMVGLDPQSAFNLKRMMREHADKGNTVLFSTHVLEIAEKVCDRIMIIDCGKIIYKGTMEALKSGEPDGDLEKIFLKMTAEAGS